MKTIETTASAEINTALIEMLQSVEATLSTYYPDAHHARQSLRRRTLHYAADMHELLQEAQGRTPQ